MNSRTVAETSPEPKAAGQTVPAADAPALRFQGFAFDRRRGELRGRDGAPVPLRPKADALLRQFLARPGELLSREALMAALWPQTVVTDDSLVQCVGELRAALDDRSQRVIRTVPRRGYRFEAEVSADAAGAEGMARPVPSAHSHEPAEPEGAAPAALDPASSSSDPATVPAVRRLLRDALVPIAVTVGAVLGIAAWQTRPEAIHIDEALAARSTIAILPFEVAGDDPMLAAAANAIGEEIAQHVTSRVGMRGIARSATAAYAGPSPQLARLASELKATLAVSGRVGSGPVPGRVVVDVSLVRIDTGEVFWSRRFERDDGRSTGRPFGIGEQVVNAVRTRGGSIGNERTDLDPSTAGPVELALLGWQDINRATSPADLQRARGRFELAQRADPGSVLVLNGLSAACIREDALPGGRLDAPAASACERSIERARALAPDDATALLVWATWQIRNGRAELALPAIEKANQQTASYPNGYVLLGRVLMLVGRVGETPAAASRAVEIGQGDPFRVSLAHMLIAEAALMRGDPAAGREAARRAVAEMPSNPEPHAVLAAAEALGGGATEAAAEMAAFRKLRPAVTVATFDDRRPSLQPEYLSAREHVYQGLRRAGLPER